MNTYELTRRAGGYILAAKCTHNGLELSVGAKMPDSFDLDLWNILDTLDIAIERGKDENPIP